MAISNVQDVAGPLPGTVPVPLAAPGNVPPGAAPVPSPAAVANGPAAAPLVAAPPPAVPEIPITADVPPPTNPVQAAQQNYQQTVELGKTDVANQQAKSDLELQQAQAKQAFDEQNARALAQFQAQQALHRQAAEAQIDNLRNQYETQPFTSLWSKLSTGQRVATALSVLAAGISWNSNHTNRALDMLDKAESEDLDIQKEQHASLLHSIQLAMEGKKDLEASQLHELSDWQAQQAAKWQAIASKMQTLLATNKGNIDQAAVRRTALEANAKATQAWEGATTAKATANHMDAQAALARAQASEVPSVIEKNQAEAARDRAIASGEIGPQGGVNVDIKIGNEIQKRLNADKELPKLFSSKEEISKGLAQLGPSATGFQVQSAIDSWVKTAAGGRATSFQVNNFKNRLGGLWDKIERNIATGTDGGYTEHDKKVIRDAFAAADKEVTGAIKESRDKHESALKEDPILSKRPDAVKSALDERFGAEPGGSDMVTITNRKTGETKRVTRDEAKKLGAI